MAQTVVLDTNILIGAFGEKPKSDHQSIPKAILEKKFCLGWDSQRSICKEYEKHLSGLTSYQKWLQTLQQRNQVCYVTKSDLLPSDQDFLKAHGCHQASDHVFIGVAFHSGKILVSEDSDMGKGPKGHESPHPKALKYLTDNMGLTVYDAAEAYHNLT